MARVLALRCSLAAPGGSRRRTPTLEKRVTALAARAALPGVPEPDARRLERAARGRPEQPDPRAARRGQERARRASTSWWRATAISCSTARRSRRARLRSGSGRSLFLVARRAGCSRAACAGAARREPAALRARSARARRSCSNDAVLARRRRARRGGARARAAAAAAPPARQPFRAASANVVDLPRPAARARRRPRRRHARPGRLRARAARARGARCSRTWPRRRRRRPRAAAARCVAALAVRDSRWSALGVYLAGRQSRRARRRSPSTTPSRAQQLEAMVERLAARLNENPDDVEGWKLLGRSYGALGRFPEAADAYAKAAARAPRDAQLLADFADVLAMAHGQRLQGEPEKLVAARARARSEEPQGARARRHRGVRAQGLRRGACATGSACCRSVAADSEDARSIRGEHRGGAARIAEARAAAARGAEGHGVAFARSSRRRRRPDDTVFIFARAARGAADAARGAAREGARAAARVRARRLDGDGAGHEAVGLSARGGRRARLASRAAPTPQPGDLQGASAPVANDASGVTVVIDSVVK